jgi:hypothetical protein
MQAHDASVRTMVWSHNDNWMVTGDHGGYVKYWQSNMNNVKMFQAHKEPIRGIRYFNLHFKAQYSELSINHFLIFLIFVFIIKINILPMSLKIVPFVVLASRAHHINIIKLKVMNNRDIL